ncbi:formate/nitrite transporter family protein [Arcobacter arenosus]|uniref:Formate/nitrite transporter family protein n=1 Tax=Arcobacter arenosus TaxID=2576037 RepID=A0A5R8XX14_9BACT|nr:formate/nitrite transporter family protein [Arcobacter arenosus]TLP35557.1 formate/nitrite transporter family protein [Arcobacter arenosus]
MLSPAEAAKAVSGGSGHKANMPMLSIIFLSIMAGGSIAMGDIFWAHATVGVAKATAPGIANFLGGIAFSAGLMMVVFFGGHLFTSSLLTGVTTMEHKLPLSKMAIYWIIVWVFNFVGSVLIAYMYYRTNLPLKYDGEILKHFMALGAGKTSLAFDEAFIRAIFCNVFVCMAVWTAIAAKDTAGKILGIAFLIGAFVASGYEHCVANMFIITEGLLAKAHYLAEVGGNIEALSHLAHVSVDKINNLTIEAMLVKNLIPVTLGNIVGGLFFVGIIGFMSHKVDMKND